MLIKSLLLLAMLAASGERLFSMPTPVRIDTSVNSSDHSAADISNSSGPYHFHALGAEWSFTGSFNGGMVHAYKSTNDGATWTEQDAGNGPVDSVSQQASMFFDGVHTVYILVTKATAGGSPHPSKLELHSFSLLTGTFGGAIGPQSPTARKSQSVLGIVQFSDLTFRAFYNDDQGTTSHTLYFQDFDGATWSNETVVATGAANGSARWIQINVTADVCHLVYQINLSQTGYWYVQIARNGTMSNLHNFTQSIVNFGATAWDGLVELDNNVIVLPFNGPPVVTPPFTAVFALRGTPISAPVWSLETVNNGAGDYELNAQPTLVRLANGSEQIFWTFLSFIGPQSLSAESAIATATNSGSGWGATTTLYDIQLNPFGDPDVTNDTSDAIFYVSVEQFGGNVYVNFDGFTTFFGGTGHQPNFTFSFAGPSSSPTCSLNATPTTIDLAGDPVTLSWTTANSPTTAAINNGVGAVNPDGGSVVVHPTSSTTYVLTVTNANGTSQCFASVVITCAEAGCNLTPALTANPQPCELEGS